MRAHAELRAVAPAAGHPGCRLALVRDAAPVAWRPTPDAVYLIGTAASPVGDDDVGIDIDVEAGAELRLRSVAATVAWRARGNGSDQRITARVAGEGMLDWQPEPLIATAGCAHRQHARVVLAPDARLRWVEELVLGRHGEPPGRLDLRLDVDVGGRPLLRHQLALGPGAPGWEGPADMGRWRCAGLVVLAGPGMCAPADEAGPNPGSATVATFDLEGPGTLRLALAADLPSLRAALGRCGSDERTF